MDSGIYALEIVADDGATEIVPVITGAKVGTTVEIVQGVEPDVRIIAP